MGSAGWLLPTALFAVFVVGAAPSVHWLDSGNLVASAWTMGVAHPPGEPVWLATARLAQLIPVGDIAFRTTLLSAACVALCAVPLLALCRACLPTTDDRSRLLAVLLVSAVLLGLAAQLQALRGEVYGPTALVLVLALLCAVRGGLRGSAAVGLLLGLGAGLHPLLCVAAIPALVLARVLSPGAAGAMRSPVGLRDSAALLGAGALGLASQAWLPLRAAAVPSASWGVPDTFSRLLDVVLARNFARNFGGEESSLVENLAIVGKVWAVELLPVLLLVVLWVGLSRRTTTRVLLAWGGVALLWLLGNALTVLPQNKVFPTNPDLLGYLFVGLLALVPVVFLALRAMGRVGLLLAVLVFAAQLWSGNGAGQSSNHLARSFATAQSAGLPAGAILMTSGNDTAFVWSYLQRVERRRSDLVLVHRVLLGHEHERLRLGGDERLAALGIPWSSELRGEPGRFLAAFRRPFFIERREAEQGFVEGGQLHRYGLVASGGVVEEPWLVGLRHRTLAEFEQERYRMDQQARLVLAYYRELWGEAR